MIRQLSISDVDFEQTLSGLLDRKNSQQKDVINDVEKIIADVRARGDKALLEYTQRFDRVNVDSMDTLCLEKDQLHSALERIDSAELAALKLAASRVKAFHEKQLQPSWTYDDQGSELGQLVRPIDRAGLYVPGGKAAYPSSVLMTAIPAKVAGVEELIMCVPMPDGVVNDRLLAAASIADVDKVFLIGGAQAIAAMAYGTERVPRVDKIVGPGNIYVATAKQLVFGQVGIDMIAGPSEVLIYCDENANPDWIAMDLFAQAEHDELAQSILICEHQSMLDKVALSIEKLIHEMPRAQIIKKSLASQGALIKVDNQQQALDLINHIAAEHLQLMIAKPKEIIDQIRHAGAIFMGYHNAEALGDYCAGPNHVLPTAGTARFSSPLGVYDFQKKTSLINLSPEKASEIAHCAEILALSESLNAHAQSAAYRKIKT